MSENKLKNDKIIKIIKEIQDIRKSKMLVYITGDRRRFETKIGMDVFPMIYEHLSQIGDVKKLDLLIYSTGGITMAGFGLVNLLREFCKEFNVLIPFKALSAATLICLGANEIIMGKLGQLSPIDPSIPHPLGPSIQNPIKPQVKQTIPISVEDVSAYIELAKDSGLKKEKSIQLVFDKLTNSVNPLALGAVHRKKEQIKFLADYLLSYHLKDVNQRKMIINTLIKERFSHNYLIGRNEAKNILKLNIIDIDINLEKLIMDLFNEYSEILLLNEEFSEEIFLGKENQKTGIFNRAIIQSENLIHAFQTQSTFQRHKIHDPKRPIPQIGYSQLILRQGWIKV